MNIKNALNIFFPLKCALCNKIGTALCDKCEKKLNENKINLIQEDSIKINKYEEIKVNKFFIYRYNGIIRKLLINYKFNDSSYLSEAFAKIISKNEKVCRFLKSYDIIIPVPLHKKRKLERGYNQVELIAKKIDNINVNNNLLIKIKNIKPQSKKGIKDRIRDVSGVYKIQNIDKIKDKRILIFDDIYTTGSTIKECIKELSKFTKKIGVLIIAKDYMEVKDGRFS